MKKACALILLLFLIWVILSGHSDIFYLLSGFVCCVLAAQIIKGLSLNSANRHDFSYRSILYFIWLAKEILICAVKVSLMVWSPKLNLNSDMKYINTKIKTKSGRVLFASSITLTPGTITIDLKSDSLLVHALNKEDLKELEHGKMEDRIREI